MSKIHAPRKIPDALQMSAKGSHVFKISLKGVPPVTSDMWAKMRAASRIPSKNRRFSEIADVADVSF